MLNRILSCSAVIALIGCIACAERFQYFTEKPSYVQSCRIFEPGFTKCSTASIQQLMEQVGKGIPEFQQEMGSIDPVRLDKLIFKQDNNEAATLRADLTNLTVTGLSQVKIKESKVSKKDFSWETKIFMPVMRIEGQYKMAGRILLIPLQGHGDFFIEIENMDMAMHTKTRLYEKGGFTFYNVTSVRVDLDMTGVRTNFANIFNGNSPEVERQTNALFNQNWREFFEALRPLITETVEKVLLDLLRGIFNALPANFLVEDIPTPTQLYGKP